jgi:hypothetical protein
MTVQHREEIAKIKKEIDEKTEYYTSKIAQDREQEATLQKQYLKLKVSQALYLT